MRAHHTGSRPGELARMTRRQPMTMKHSNLKVGILAVALASVGAIAAVAHARGGHHPGRGHAMFKQHLSSRIEEALGAVAATPAQRDAIHAARDRAFATVEEAHGERGPRIERAVALFEADRVDPAQVEALRAAHDEAAARTGEAIAHAITEVHATLDAQQRKALVEWARAHRPEHRGGRHAGFMKRMAAARIEDALDAAQATAAQRETIHGARDRAFAALEAGRPDPGAALDAALDLFAADRLDSDKIAALRAEHQAKARAAGEAIVQAVTEAHDALGPAQRRAIGDFVRAHHPQGG
ncbi:MAG: periplasmic heavy metal sensor [Myxococcales bacterium]|nr:periplasmic heavy metal sensor [Myxococcales bacterium]